MGRDNQAKDRQFRRKVTREARRASYARILIVTEGSKTEPLYLEEIRAAHQLHSANVEVQSGQLGTAPIQVVRYAQQLFEDGDLRKGIHPKSFDQVYTVFDRDDHDSYFNAIVSIPSFELWLLLHYEDIQTPIHRDEVMDRLKQHITGYDKGAGGAFVITRDRLETATQRAQALAAKFNAYTAPEPFTALHELVTLLTTLRA
ncbi:RloB family protein [Rhodoferax sp.]|uniref:RloB family protein n=1 Tax=Rhodoferax sp. TaxID=50421 RepID=UPI00374DF261